VEERLGRYRLLQKLATGGMAEVFLAAAEGPQGFEKTVVLKRVLPHLAQDPQFTGMFLDEARLAAMLEHPNIVQIFDLGEVNGQYFIAMEYVRGHSIAQLIRTLRKDRRFIPFPIAAFIMAKVAAALHYAHTLCDKTGRPLNIVHRDVSPDNIIISNSGVPKLIDFGIAKAITNEQRTQAGAIKGKFAYMSPEQIRGQVLDARSDVFAAGVCLYELTTLSRPFGGQSDIMTLSAIINESPEPPSSRRPDYPKEIEAICLRCMAKDPQARFRNCRELEEALDAFLATTNRVGERDVAEFVSRVLGAAPDGTPGPATEPVASDSQAGQKAGISPQRTAPGHPASEPPLKTGKTLLAQPNGPVEGKGAGLLLLLALAVSLLAAAAIALWLHLRPEPEPPSVAPLVTPNDVIAAPVEVTPQDVLVQEVRGAETVRDVRSVDPVAQLEVSPADRLEPQDHAAKGPGPGAQARKVFPTIAFAAPAGVSVFIDGRMVGTTPLAPQRVSAGSHRVEFRGNGKVVVRFVVVTNRAPHATARW